MARTLIPTQTLAALDGSAIAALTWTAADQANGMYFVNNGDEILLAKSTSTTCVVTISSVADQFGRSANKTPSVVSGAFMIAGPFPVNGWNQRGASDLGKVFVDMDVDINLSFAVVKVSRS